MLSFLVAVIIVGAIVGVLLWAFNQITVIDPTVKRFVTIFVVCIFALWVLLALLGAVPGELRLPQLR